MTGSKDLDRETQLAEFKQLYLKKQLSEAAFRSAVSGLGMDPAEVLNEMQTQTDDQTNSEGRGNGFVEPDWNVHGGVQQAGRDIVMGDQLKAGRDIHQTLISQFGEVLKRVESLPKEEQAVVRSAVETVRDQVMEIQQGGIEDETSPKYGALKKGLKTLVEWVPDIADVVLAFLKDPATGVVSAVRKVAERIKSEME